MKYTSLRVLSYDYHGDSFENIYKNRLNGDSTTVLDFDIFGHPAFFVMTNGIVQSLTKIYKQHTSISLLLNKLPRIAVNQYEHSILVDEIGLTNELENVHSTRREIEDSYDVVIKKEKKNPNTRFYGMIEKYITLMSGDSTVIRACQDIRGIYDKLVLDEVLKENKEDAPDGVVFRSGPVYVQGAHGNIIHEGISPENKIIDSVDKAIRILNDSEIDSLISISIFHYLFGFIHPFYNGNGRTSRYISSLMLSKTITPIVALKLSSAIKREYTKYKSIFKNTNEKRNYGDLTEFIQTFLEFIAHASNDVFESLNKNNDLLYKLESSIEQCNLFNKGFAVLWILVQNSLFAVSGLSISDLVEISQKGKTSVENELKVYTNELKIVDVYREGHKKIYRLDITKLLSILSEHTH